MPSRPLTVSLVNSLVVDRDAISNVVRQNADALAGVPGGARVKIFVRHKSEVRDSRLVCRYSAAELAADPHFRASDVVVFHMGYMYDLLPAIQLAPRTAFVVGLYFGVTPPHLMNAAQRPEIDQSYRQGSHLAAADAVFITADSLRADLRLFGLPAEKAVKIGLPVSFRPAVPTRPAAGPARFLYVSRFVRAKGTLDLLAGFHKAVGRGADVRLDLVGSMNFSDRAYLAKLQSYVADHKLADRVTFHFDITNAELANRYAAAHCLVSPSHHEGFGVPIVEAYEAGCYVICSDAYASPETAGGLGLVYPTGDTDALAGRLIEYAAAFDRGLVPFRGGLVPRETWTARAAAYAATFSPAAYADQFRAAVLAGLKTGISPAAREFGATLSRPMVVGGTAAADHPQTDVFEKYAALRDAAKWARVAERAAA